MKLEDAKKVAIGKALVKCKWNIVATAKELEISRATLYRAVKRYGLKRGK